MFLIIPFFKIKSKLGIPLDFCHCLFALRIVLVRNSVSKLSLFVFVISNFAYYPVRLFQLDFGIPEKQKTRN